MIAALPMYDWPEVRPATDRLWVALRDALREAGVAAPDALTRDVGLTEAWTSPLLVLGQTCGLPLVRDLEGRVAVFGAPDLGLPGCAPGWYRSAVVVRADDARTTLAAFRGARLAFNGTNSQSGWGAMLHHVAPLARERRFFGAAAVTGSHDASGQAVAAGGADIAAIDLMSWRLFQRYRPAAARLRVLFLTEPTPGLPYIAAPGADVARYRQAIGGAIAGLDAEARDQLGLRGFQPLTDADYSVVRERVAASEALVDH